MKRGTPNHPKVFELADALSVRQPTAVGYLELLFHFTATYAPAGNIGRYEDKRIAAGVNWVGRIDKLIDGLVKSGFVDRDPVHRLVIHDWHDHADEAVKKRLERAGTPFASLPKVGEKVGEKVGDTGVAQPSHMGDTCATSQRPMGVRSAFGSDDATVNPSSEQDQEDSQKVTGKCLEPIQTTAACLALPVPSYKHMPELGDQAPQIPFGLVLNSSSESPDQIYSRKKKFLDDSHARFYETYWLHVNRKRSRDAWPKAICAVRDKRKIQTVEAAEFLIAKVVEQKMLIKSRADLSWYERMHSSSWLNGERWNDDFPDAPTAQAGSHSSHNRRNNEPELPRLN